MRRLAWLLIISMVTFAAVMTWCLCDTYWTRNSMRQRQIGYHYRNVHEIQAMSPTADNMAKVATNYLYLGIGAVTALTNTMDLIVWLYAAIILCCVCGIILPLKVLRTITPVNRERAGQ